MVHTCIPMESERKTYHSSNLDQAVHAIYFRYNTLAASCVLSMHPWVLVSDTPVSFRLLPIHPACVDPAGALGRRRVVSCLQPRCALAEGGDRVLLGPQYPRRGGLLRC